MLTVNGISTAEGKLNSGEYSSSEFVEEIQRLMGGVTPKSLLIIGIWIAVLLIGCFVAVFLLIRFGYKIDEQKHKEIVDELEKRHAEVGFDKSELAVEEAPQE